MALTMKSGVQYLGLDYCGANDTGWTLLGPMGSRLFTKQITYSSAFVTGTVAIGLSVMSVYMIGSDQGLKLDLKALAVTVVGFTLQVSTWDNCQIKGLGVQWLAYTQ